MGYASRKTEASAIVCFNEEHRERARGARVTMSYRVWPDALADDFRTHASIQGAVAYEWRSAMEGNARDHGRRGEVAEPLSDRGRMRRASVTKVNT